MKDKTVLLSKANQILSLIFKAVFVVSLASIPVVLIAKGWKTTVPLLIITVFCAATLSNIEEEKQRLKQKYNTLKNQEKLPCEELETPF